MRDRIGDLVRHGRGMFGLPLARRGAVTAALVAVALVISMSASAMTWSTTSTSGPGRSPALRLGHRYVLAHRRTPEPAMRMLARVIPVAAPAILMMVLLTREHPLPLHL
jgi:hypothetical protein